MLRPDTEVSQRCKETGRLLSVDSRSESVPKEKFAVSASMKGWKGHCGPIEVCNTFGLRGPGY